MKNVCIVGYGGIGVVHASALKNTENARLYAVCDIDLERICAALKEYDIKTFDNFDDVLLCPEIDTVHICTPHYLHYEMVVRTLAARKIPIVEKPAAMTSDEFSKMRNMPDSGKICCVLQNRYNPCIQRLKEIIENGEYGEPQTAKAVLAWCRDEAYYKSGEWRGKWATEGGSLLINQAVHTLDMVIYLIGNAASVRANAMNYSLENVIETEDTFVAYIEYKNGIHGMFFATNAYGANSTPEIEIVFPANTVRYIDGKLIADGKVIAEDTKPLIGKPYWGSGHIGLIGKIYDEDEYFSVADIENTMDTMFAMYESAEKKRRKSANKIN